MSNVRRTSRLGLAIAVALLLMAALAPSVSASTGGTTRWVDKDGKAGPTGCGGSAPAFKHIQSAVNASGPHDTVLVCPGRYRETVTIDGNRAGLTLRGTNPWKAVLVPPKAGPDTAGFASELDMITIHEVNDVTVRGLLVSAANESDCSLVDVGILVLGSMRAQILGNQLYATDHGTDCGLINGIIVSNEDDPTASVAGAGSTGGIPASAVVAHNLVTNFFEWGIAVGDAPIASAEITDNSLHYYLKCGCMSDTASVARTSRPESRFAQRWQALQPAGIPLDESAGIFQLDGASALIDLNVIQSADDLLVLPAGEDASEALGFGIEAIDGDGNLIIRDNLIRRVVFGIFLDGISDARVKANVVRKTLGGIALLNDSDGNRVRGNEVRGTEGGIVVDSSSLGNIFRDNTAFSNEGNACEDDSTGSGTDYTASTWLNNTGNTDEPDGICPPAP